MDELPHYSASRVLALRDKLMDEVFLEFFHCTLSGDLLVDLIRELQAKLPGSVEYHALLESLRLHAGQELTPQLCYELSWRLAGNLDRLHAGRAAMPWTSQDAGAWVLLQVTRTRAERSRRGKTGARVYCRTLAGVTTPDILDGFWSRSQCSIVARNIGFSAPWGRYPYLSAEQLVGLRLYGAIDPARAQGNSPWFYQVACPPSCLEWNRRILKIRVRITPCPNNWTHHCHQCAVGYMQCDGATHRLNYVRQDCPECDRTTYFDPETSMQLCIQCARRQRMRHQHPVLRGQHGGT